MFALRELFAHPDKYGLDLLPVTNQVAYEIVELDGQIDLALAADLAGITVNELYQLNPAFNRWATAPGGPHRLLLPRRQGRRVQGRRRRDSAQRAHQLGAAQDQERRDLEPYLEEIPHHGGR